MKDEYSSKGIETREVTLEEKRALSCTPESDGSACCVEMDAYVEQCMIEYQGARIDGKYVKFIYCPYCGTSITTKGVGKVMPNREITRRPEDDGTKMPR